MIRHIITLLLLLAGRASFFAQEPGSFTVKSYMKQASQSYNAKDYEKCRDYALKAIGVDSTYGKAYILIGIAYVGSAKTCFKHSFEESMVYCLAVDKFQKAKEVDESVKEEAEKLIKVYSKYFPSREGFFIEPVAGEKYLVKCWINEYTTVRFSGGNRYEGFYRNGRSRYPAGTRSAAGFYPHTGT